MTTPSSPSEDPAAIPGLDRLNPPDIVAFFAGLHRRVAEAVKTDDEEADSFGDGGGREAAPDGGESTVPVEDMTAIADLLDRVIDRTKSVGYSLEPDVAVEEGDESGRRPVLPAEADAVLRRIEAGAAEVARRLAGLSFAAWEANSELLAEARTAVGEVARPLRAMERAAETDD